MSLQEYQQELVRRLRDRHPDHAAAYQVLRDVVEGLKVGPPFSSWKMRVTVWLTSDLPMTAFAIISIRWVAPHALTGEETELENQKSIRLEDVLRVARSPMAGAEGFLHFIRQLLKETVLHELAESLTFRGERRWDPHADEGTRV